MSKFVTKSSPNFKHISKLSTSGRSFWLWFHGLDVKRTLENRPYTRQQFLYMPPRFQPGFNFSLKDAWMENGISGLDFRATSGGRRNEEGDSWGPHNLYKIVMVSPNPRFGKQNNRLPNVAWSCSILFFGARYSPLICCCGGDALYRPSHTGPPDARVASGDRRGTDPRDPPLHSGPFLTTLTGGGVSSLQLPEKRLPAGREGLEKCC